MNQEAPSSFVSPLANPKRDPLALPPVRRRSGRLRQAPRGSPLSHLPRRAARPLSGSGRRNPWALPRPHPGRLDRPLPAPLACGPGALDRLPALGRPLGADRHRQDRPRYRRTRRASAYWPPRPLDLRSGARARFGADPNLWQGAFELVRDFKPKAGTENTVDVVLATPNGPRPAIFVVSREPQGLKFDQSKEFASRYIPFGMDAMYGVTPAFWQTAVRIQPT
jgi:hypothetical protein